jgi:hypothetical protein
MFVRPLILAAVTMTTACARDGDAGSTFSGGPHVGSDEPASSSTERSTTSSGDAASSGESNDSSDISTGMTDGSSSGSPIPDLGPPGPEGCQGKIDFLFVISSSGTMTSHQDRVHASLPEFIAAIEDNFVGVRLAHHGGGDGPWLV